MTFLKRLCLLVLLVLAPNWPMPALAQISVLRTGVVKIVVSSPVAKTGTGVIVRRDAGEVLVLTAAHVVTGADRISVQFFGGRSLAAETRHIEFENPAQGLALLRVAGSLPPEIIALPLATEFTVAGGEQVNMIGHQASIGDWGVLTGNVSGRKGREIVIQAPIQEQTSGGPVILKDRVVGLVQRKDPSGNFGYAVTALAIREYVEGNQVSLAPLPSLVPPVKLELDVKPAAETRHIVINGPKPLYAPFKTGDIFQECANCPEMVVIVPDANGFTIGTAESEAKWGRENDEKPFGPIRFAWPYAIGRFEVTRAQFGSSDIKPEPCNFWTRDEWQLDSKRNWKSPGFEQDAAHPVVCVSWNDTQDYLKWLNGQLGLAQKDTYRLPSEAEWEYAARGETTTARYWGNEPERACEYANVGDRTAKQKYADWMIHECSDGFVFTAPVGRFRPNKFGLHDIIGNVYEWVQDCYTEQYAESIRNGVAFEAANCGLGVARGGSWDNYPEFARAADRFRLGPGDRGNILGFRVARTL